MQIIFPILVSKAIKNQKGGFTISSDIVTPFGQHNTGRFSMMPGPHLQ
jgi:hypothetical protein